jgi:hypothetical protein
MINVVLAVGFVESIFVVYNVTVLSTLLLTTELKISLE